MDRLPPGLPPVVQEQPIVFYEGEGQLENEPEERQAPVVQAEPAPEEQEDLTNAMRHPFTQAELIAARAGFAQEQVNEVVEAVNGMSMSGRGDPMEEDSKTDD